MWGVVSVWLCACLFIHLGLGQAVNKVLHIDFVLFRCVKCLSFWSVLTYSLFFVHLPVEFCLLIAFAAAYAALWADLLLAFLATKYENLYKDLETEGEPNH